MKILLCGAGGRMGRALAELAAERGETVVCGVDFAPHSASFPIVASYRDVKEEADVLIDFSSAGALDGTLAYARDKRLPLLLGATGYGKEDVLRIQSCSAEIPVFVSGNFSIGVALMRSLVRRAAEVLGESFDAEIVERHHRHKKDAPSGTALLLEESLKAARPSLLPLYGRHGTAEERRSGELGIHSLRGGTVVGEHEVWFAGEDETLSVTHSAGSRRVFANGALVAAKWLVGRSPALYGMEDLI